MSRLRNSNGESSSSALSSARRISSKSSAVAVTATSDIALGSQANRASIRSRGLASATPVVAAVLDRRKVPRPVSRVT